MIYLKWALMVPLSLLVTVLGVLLCPILPLFASAQEGLIDNGTSYGIGPRLPKRLNWFMTPDNSLNGDNGWKTEHWQWRYKLPQWLSVYVGYVGWLLRNPGQGFGFRVLTGDPIIAKWDGNVAVNDNPGVEGHCTVHCQDLFQWVWVKRITETKCIYCNFGWNIKGCIDGTERVHLATFTFSPRISNWK